MRLVIQRVSGACVLVGKDVVGRIDRGLFVLVGVGEGDTKEDAVVLAEKLSKMRIMADEKDKMNLSIKEVGGSVLAVSQFTLYADTSKGNRPSFIKAGKPEIAEKVYNHFVESLQGLGIETKTGKFGEYMNIDLHLDGPVTILLDSK